ncbi:GntR family transcriptional regulator [Arthrobacter silviterrae]|uniref:GntR family transcriptional regulator n=1 Tax=Arthrobacter silviterrae TaxID=2026658 RepID=A0ABX0D8J6_9MICC|nr:GntR family transcriptional regulator [Arthrobacter silviterrae]MDQ0279510.1 GntR family transcriptional regulator [Arthrobacter silviterrae]NGN82011.1 GntR family transcriptional regulator [Arthrobacter silviterrae]
MFVLIDPATATPVFAQIAESIATQIATGTIATGERLPAAKVLAESIGVNFHTVLRAYQELRNDGQIELRRGRGAVVIGAPTANGVRVAVARAAAEAKSAGIPIGTLLALVRKEYES